MIINGKKKYIWQGRIQKIVTEKQFVHFYNFSPTGSVILSSTIIPLDEPSLIALIRRICFLSSINVPDCGPEMTKNKMVINQINGFLVHSIQTKITK